MTESIQSRLWRWGGNLFPAYRRSGARLTYVAADFQRVKVKLPCNWQTKNHMGITWGGSVYAALDPIFGVMLYKLLQQKYRVIDSTANIRFIKPGREALYADFIISDSELSRIRQNLSAHDKLIVCYQIHLTDKQGEVHAVCGKEIHISRQRKRLPFLLRYL